MSVTRMSRLFVPIMKADQVDTSLSHSTRLLLQAGYIRQVRHTCIPFPLPLLVIRRQLCIPADGPKGTQQADGADPR
jgi:hypothetical protein